MTHDAGDTKTNQVNPVIDPTSNVADMIGDPSGLTGITQTTKSSTGQKVNDEQAILNSMSLVAVQNAEDRASESDSVTNISAKTPATTQDEFALPHADDATTGNAHPSSVQGEQSVSGDMPAPESDDDILANAKKMGMQ